MLETKITLDIAAANGCETPGCTCKDNPKEPIILSGTCHPGAPTNVSYVQGAGVIEVSCFACNMIVAEIKVAEA